MKRKITAVLLCVALLLTLSVNILAEASTTDSYVSATDTQEIPITEEVVINIDENGAEIIENENLGNSTVMPLSQNAGVISGAIYRIKNVASGKYMNVDYGTDANGTNIYQWTGDGSTEQKWRVVYSSSTDSYMFYSMCSSNGTNRVLDVTRGSNPLTNGQNIKLYSPTDPTSQEIKIVSLGSNRYKLVMSANQNLAVTSYGTSNGSASGTSSTSAGNIFLATYSGATNQQWQFELLQNPNTGATPTGHLDTVSSSIIGGWAYQSNIPNTALTVHIYIINNSTGEQTIIPVAAGGYRADLASAGYGNGYHAFRYSINWKTYKPGTYTVRAYAIGVNSSNPQLTNSPKTFTVRNPAGNVEYLDSDGIGGWAWKPDAPNSTIDVHIYIYKSDGTQVAFYPVTASQPRSDLASAGYGNGNHGFSKAIDWSTFPEEKLRVVVYMVDGSGYNPSLYSGNYDNRMPINVMGMVDGEGADFSTWATSEVIGYLYNIGTPNVYVANSATPQQIIDRIKQSSFVVFSSHGLQYSIEYCVNPNTTNEDRGAFSRTNMLGLQNDYFSNTRCLLLNTCYGAKGSNNIAKEFLAKGVQTVVGFEESIGFRRISKNSNTVDTTYGSELWAKIFVRELGNGDTVQTAADEAFEGMVNSHLQEKGYEESDIDIFEETEEGIMFLENEIYLGLDSYRVFGSGNLVVKH